MGVIRTTYDTWDDPPSRMLLMIEPKIKSVEKVYQKDQYAGKWKIWIFQTPELLI